MQKYRMNNTKAMDKEGLTMNIEQFQDARGERNFAFSSQLEQFETYYETLVEWNEKMNLTAITEKEEVYLKHFYDSISASFYFDFIKPFTFCDVGAGAGFPSIPLKICFPDIHVTIVIHLINEFPF